MVELDDEQHMPEGVDTAVWQRLVDARKQKVESEQQVRERGLISIRRKCFWNVGVVIMSICTLYDHVVEGLVRRKLTLR